MRAHGGGAAVSEIPFAALRPRSRREGISLGQLREKQDILIRQLERKFGIMDAVLGKLPTHE